MKAIIVGSSGQDGHYLRQLLESKGYELLLVPSGAETDDFLRHAIESKPDEIYNLAGLTRAPDFYEGFKANALVALQCFEAARRTGCKVFQASSCEIYRHTHTPYSSAKLAAHHLAQQYREAGAWVATGGLHNHESPLRTHEFVSQKVCTAAAKREPVVLGNLHARRDWGHAQDVVRAMWMIMQQPKPGYYVVSTGEVRTVAKLCEVAYAHVGLNWRDYVTKSDALVRQNDQDEPYGDAGELRAIGWTPEYTFEQMIGEMVDAAAK